MNTLLENVEKYWTGRSEGYCEVNVDELNSWKLPVWQELLNRYAPKIGDRPLRVLDIGTGPGFFAIAMATCGHEVTAVDYTEAMLAKARKNAQDFKVLINFRQMDAHKLDFESETFDLIITRNLTWNLEDPEKAYGEWHRVLAPGGRLLNFDANWYHHLYDSGKRAAYENDRRVSKAAGINDHYTCTDIAAMESIALNLPLSRTLRPQWDAAVLLNIGFRKIAIEKDMGAQVWNQEEQLNYASTPMFMIRAEK